MNPTKEWFWEGNVVDGLVRYLEERGWRILSQANTHTKAQGPDIHATRDETILFVEVKGYPSIGYRDPRRSLEKKPTNPTNQAQHWYAHAVLQGLRLRTKHPEARIALGFPDFPRYRSLITETHVSLKKVELGLLVMRRDGDVEELNFR